MYLLFFAVVLLAIFQLFFDGRVKLGLVNLCFDLEKIFYRCN